MKKQASALNASEQLGKALFFDARLSSPAGQSCASCHSPEHGFSHPDSKLATAEGAAKGLFGNRNVPSITYIKFTPEFHKVTEDGESLHVGGFFLDGREKTLEDQATKPMLNPVEMGIASEQDLISKIKESGYEKMFNDIYGKDALKETKKAVQYISQAIADYERSVELAPFSSKYDAYLAGKAQLSQQELQGLKLFEAEDKGNCAACHPSKLDKESGFPPLFTDFTYDNLGVPANKNNPFLNNPKKYNLHGHAYKDNGLGDILKDANENGKFKVSTLRNIALTAPYMHNGVFSTLKEVVSFYNTRDSDKKWAAAEIKQNVNKDELGDLKLSDDEVEAIVAFLKTLTDDYQTQTTH
ncbi:MAG: c-type cytochrome [Gammaproteobacteria bacterium]|nr:c-type cytochrome [Gammaproteobacteria bacterium]